MIDYTPFTIGSVIGFSVLILTSLLRPQLIVGRPKLVIAFLALLTLGAIASFVRFYPPGFRIDLDASTRPMLPESDPGLAIYDKAVLDFGSDDLYIVAMRADDTIFTAQNLQTLREVTDAIARVPMVRESESLTSAITFWHNPEEFAEITRFITDIPTDPGELKHLERRALEDPIYRKVLISRDAKTAAINVSFNTRTDEEFIELDLDGKIERILDEHRAKGASFFVTGRPHIRAKGHELMVGDLILLIPIAITVAAILLTFMTGSLRQTMIPLISEVAATIWAFGAMGLLGLDMNLITLVLGPMLICLGSVYGIHIMGRYEVIAAESSTPYEAALATLRYTQLPVLIAGATTVIGFAALLLAEVPATSELGALAMFGIASISALSLTFVPAALALIPLEKSDEPAPSEGGEPLYAGRSRFSDFVGGRIDGMTRGFTWAVVNHPGKVIVAWFGAATVAIALIPRIIVDTDFLSFFPANSPVRENFKEVNQLLTGTVPVYVIFHGEDEGTFREPSNLRDIERVQARLEELDGIDQVLGITDFVKVVQSAILGGEAAHAAIPETRPEVAESIFLIPKSKSRRFSTTNHSSANLLVRTDRLGSRAVRALGQDIASAIETLDPPPKLASTVTGNAILLNRSADGIARNQVTQVGFAATAILFLVWAVFRSAKVAFLSLIPNVFPVLMFFGVLGTQVAYLSLATGLIGCIALGIAVDDTVHYLISYKRQRDDGKTPEEAAQYCTRTVGRPIVLTSVMLVVGFLVMHFSNFTTLREFGYLTAATMVVALLSDLLLTPALLVKARI